MIYLQVYQAVIYRYYAYLKHHFDLRPNEPRGLDVTQASMWLVRDIRTGVNMLINGRERYIARMQRKGFIDLKIRNPSEFVFLDNYRDV